jgi:cytochrome b involved in lipid metabolism
MSDNDEYAKVHEGGEDLPKDETKDDDYEYFDEKTNQAAADQEKAKANKSLFIRCFI